MIFQVERRKFCLILSALHFHYPLLSPQLSDYALCTPNPVLSTSTPYGHSAPSHTPQLPCTDSDHHDPRHYSPKNANRPLGLIFIYYTIYTDLLERPSLPIPLQNKVLRLWRWVGPLQVRAFRFITAVKVILGQVKSRESTSPLEEVLRSKALFFD